MFEIKPAEERLPGSGQVRELQESFLLQLLREDWLSLGAVKTRLRQLKLAPLAGEGVKLRYAAAELKLPAERLSSMPKRRQLACAQFHKLGRESSGNWKHIYPFVYEADPLLMYFLIVSKEGEEHAGRTERFIEELGQNLGRHMELECSVAAGLEVKGLKRLKNAFSSCLYALDSHCIPVSDRWLSPEEERRLSQIIEHADTAAFERELNALVETDNGEGRPLDICRYKAIRLLLLLAVIAGKFQSRGAALGKYLWNSHKTLAASTSREQMKEHLHELGLLAMDEVRLAYQSGGRALAEAVRKYIERNYGWELTLAAAAQLFGVEESSLSRQFKQHVGIPLADYVAKARMAKAEQLLQEQGLKLTELPLLVGYSSPGHFVSAFKKYSGKSPKEFRERLHKTR